MTATWPARMLATSCGLVAAACGTFAAASFVRAGDAHSVLLGFVAHMVAVVAVAAAARFAVTSRTELQLLAAMTAALPGVGAVLAAGHCLVAPRPDRANAHAANDDAGYEPKPARPQLEQELRVVSYSRVLREGSLEQKRNLLRRLASLGEPRYLAIVRKFLADPETELRLCAYAELAAVGQRHEAGIARLRAAAASAADGENAAELAALAAAQHAYATSGALDDEMARYWLEQAEQAASRAVELVPDLLDAQRVLALVLAASGRGEQAWQLVAAWPAEVSGDLELARAEIGFRRRDHAVCVEAVARLEAAGEHVPEWLRGVTHAEVHA